MDGLCMLYPPKCKFLTPFKWQKKKITKEFQQYVQDAIVIQGENNNISLTEFSNVKGHFMEDESYKHYGGHKHTTNGFPFLLLNYSRTSRYRASLIQTPLYYGQFPMSQQNSHIISFKKEPL